MNTSNQQHDDHVEHAAEVVAYDKQTPYTIPNALTVTRMLGSGVLLWLAHSEQPIWFVTLFIVLLVTDWVDGKIAILFHQRTELGARLDSIADAILYGCLLLGVIWLKPEFVRSDRVLIAVMLGSFMASILVALIRYHRLPAYHTRLAKTAWWVVTIGAITLLADGPLWPVRIAMVFVMIANVEELMISLILPRWQSDVPSIFHALRRVREEREA